MEKALLDKLSRITDEERRILDGNTNIDRGLYMLAQDDTINAQKLLSTGKLITLRPHTRFIHFPAHTHDYVEVVYMCRGTTVHIVEGTHIRLQQGELLFMNQSARHEVMEAGEQDIAVNFIVLPDFFNNVLSLVGEEETPLRRFIVDCLCGKTSGAGFLHFRTAGIVTVENLVENLLLILLRESSGKRKLSQMTMALLFMELIGLTQTLQIPNQQQAVMVRVLAYIETNYADGSLTELADLLHYNLYGLSREIRQKTGKTYTQLAQEKRLAQAAFLLKSTDRNIDDIANAVGYENMGYFHRIFKECYGVSPRAYRLQIR